MLKTVGDLKKALRNIPDDMPLAAQWLQLYPPGKVEIFKIGEARVCPWRDTRNNDYASNEDKKNMEEHVAPPYFWESLETPVFVIEVGNE